MKNKTGICDECRREVSEEGMLWTKAPLDGSIWGARDICTKCYDRLWKKGIAMVAMPWTSTVLDWNENCPFCGKEPKSGK